MLYLGTLAYQEAMQPHTMEREQMEDCFRVFVQLCPETQTVKATKVHATALRETEATEECCEQPCAGILQFEEELQDTLHSAEEIIDELCPTPL